MHHFLKRYTLITLESVKVGEANEKNNINDSIVHWIVNGDS